MKKHNFYAGPSILADEVIENAAKAILDFNGTGVSLLFRTARRISTM